jgi:hypothetical protein
MFKAQIWDHAREKLIAHSGFTTARMAAENLAVLIAQGGTWTEDEEQTIARLVAGEGIRHRNRTYKVVEEA